jgi:hypothetical protein
MKNPMRYISIAYFDKPDPQVMEPPNLSYTCYLKADLISTTPYRGKAGMWSEAVAQLHAEALRKMHLQGEDNVRVNAVI